MQILSLTICRFEAKGMTQYPVVPGHEVVGTIARMLEFSSLHNIKPVIEKFSFDDINEAITRLRNGQAHYRIVLNR